MVLNLFSTLAMVRLGKVMSNLMVDVAPTNAKLRLRAARIVSALAGVETETATEALARNRWDIRETTRALRRGGSFRRA
jgi:N-acetylmuramic acid 6-phosphate etherase